MHRLTQTNPERLLKPSGCQQELSLGDRTRELSRDGIAHVLTSGVAGWVSSELSVAA
jgi:hypothetical protein